MSYSGWNPDIEDWEYVDNLPSIPFNLAEAEAANNGKPLFDCRADLRTEVQAQRPTCRSHSGTTGIEVLYYHITGQWEQFSRKWYYLLTQKYDGSLGSGWTGCSTANGIKAMQEVGCIVESLMPHDMPNINYPGKEWFLSQIEKFKGQAKVKIGSSFRVRSYDDAKAWLTSRAGYLDICMYWTPKLDSRGVCKDFTAIPAAKPPWHAVAGVCLAADRLDDDGSPMIAIANSHGTSFGDRGYFYVGRRWWERFIAYPGSLVIASSELILPTPLRTNFIDKPLKTRR